MRQFRKYQNAAIHLTDKIQMDTGVVSDFVLDQLVPICGTRPYPLIEQLFLTMMVCWFKPDYIFDWGTNVGLSARIFYEIGEHFKIPLVVHSIDLPDDVDHVEHPHHRRGMKVIGCRNVHLHQGDGLNTSLSILKLHPEIRTPLFFIDGDHNDYSVLRELKGLHENVPNSVIILHDTFQNLPSIISGPTIALTTFLNDNLDYEVVLTDTGLPGMTILYKEKTQ